MPKANVRSTRELERRLEARRMERRKAKAKPVKARREKPLELTCKDWSDIWWALNVPGPIKLRDHLGLCGGRAVRLGVAPVKGGK